MRAYDKAIAAIQAIGALKTARDGNGGFIPYAVTCQEHPRVYCIGILDLKAQAKQPLYAGRAPGMKAEYRTNVLGVEFVQVAETRQSRENFEKPEAGAEIGVFRQARRVAKGGKA